MAEGALRVAHRRKLVIGAAAALLLALAAALALAVFGGGDPKVVSIRRDPAYQDPALLQKAWALPVAQRYRAGFEPQQNPGFCGATSLVNVSRSLGVPADQATVLEGAGFTTVFGLLPGGLTLDELATLAGKRLHRQVTALHDLDLEGFRAQLRRSNDPAVRYVVNFSRRPLFGKGGGHHSPVGGYLEQDDLVLVLDVNAQFGPWLVKSDRLFEAMHTFDGRAGKPRGLLRIEAL